MINCGYSNFIKMKNTLFIFLFAAILMLSCTKSDDEPRLDSYLNKWLGSYEGTSHSWQTSPSSNAMVTTNTYSDIFIEVKKSKKDSILTLVYKDKDKNVTGQCEYKILPSGYYYSDWGAGSSYGTMSIQFNSNSLTYRSYQKCGIPCDSGTNYDLVKK